MTAFDAMLGGWRDVDGIGTSYCRTIGVGLSY